jgi:hypothetical protein
MALPSADNGFCRLPFPTKPVPRLMMTDPKAFEYVKREEPVILTDVSLTKPLVGKIPRPFFLLPLYDIHLLRLLA